MLTVSPLFKNDKPHFHSNGGELAVGCGIYTYLAGTNTPIAMYSDPSGSNVYPNPIVLNSRGEPDGQGIYADVEHEYKVVLKNTSGAVIWSMDGVKASGVGTIIVGITEIKPGSDNVTVTMSADGETATISVSDEQVTYRNKQDPENTFTFIKNLIEARKDVVITYVSQYGTSYYRLAKRSSTAIVFSSVQDDGIFLLSLANDNSWTQDSKPYSE